MIVSLLHSENLYNKVCQNCQHLDAGIATPPLSVKSVMLHSYRLGQDILQNVRCWSDVSRTMAFASIREHTVSGG